MPPDEFEQAIRMSQALVQPVTGQVLDLPTMSPGQLATVTDEIDDVVSRLKECRSQIEREIIGRFDRNRQWTVRDGGFKLSSRSDAQISEWDVDALGELLSEMVEEGVITREAATRALEPTITWKPRAAGLNALMKNPAIAARIEACRQMMEPRDRRVKVERER